MAPFEDLQIRKFKKTLLVLAVVLVGAIGAALMPEEETTTYTAEAPAPAPAKKPSRNAVYAVAKVYAKQHLGSADLGAVDDGFTDYGNGSYHVTGVADIPGKRLRWTVELQHTGGDDSDPASYTEKGFVAN